MTRLYTNDRNGPLGKLMVEGLDDCGKKVDAFCVDNKKVPEALRKAIARAFNRPIDNDMEIPWHMRDRLTSNWSLGMNNTTQAAVDALKNAKTIGEFELIIADYDEFWIKNKDFLY